MMAILGFIKDAGVVGWTIILTGVASMALVIERIKVLYFAYGLNIDEFTNKIHTLVLAKKNEEAIVVCAQLEKKPLARAFKLILEKSDRDDETIFQAQDIAMAEAVPLYTKRLHYLSMLANVATLLGLLGTIHGLILSFKAVSFADPAQKQILLTQGISLSMNNTALGLSVAIPVMLAFSILHGRQQKIMEQLAASTVRVTDWLNNRGYQAFHADTIYARGEHMPNKKVGAPPVPPKKAM